MDRGSFAVSEGSVSVAPNRALAVHNEGKSRLSWRGQAARWRKDVMEQESRLAKGKIWLSDILGGVLV